MARISIHQSNNFFPSWKIMRVSTKISPLFIWEKIHGEIRQNEGNYAYDCLIGCLEFFLGKN